MNKKKYEFIIVGSGAGGATLARELTKRRKEVLVLERGKLEEKIGTFQDALRYFETNRYTKLPRKSREGIILWRALMAGGSTVVSCGCSTRCLEEELLDLGVNLNEEFAEAEKEMNVSPIDEKLLSEGSERIKWASKELGYKMELMPKFIDPVKCQKCGKCVFGCRNGAKWTVLNYLKEAIQNGAEVVYNTLVEEVIFKNGKARGIRGVGPKGYFEILSDVVIIAAGGLATPIILQKSGIKEAGPGLFVDLFVNTYGVTRSFNQIHEPAMALINRDFHKKEGFILSPYVNHNKISRSMELGVTGFTLPNNRLIGIMTKISDEAGGRVYPDGMVSKHVTTKDWNSLKKGSSIAKEILVKAGAAVKSIIVSKPQGAHPGGTAAIGKVVGKDLQTNVDNLFVCDASVFPLAPGMPPILTITALAKHLAKKLAS